MNRVLTRAPFLSSRRRRAPRPLDFADYILGLRKGKLPTRDEASPHGAAAAELRGLGIAEQIAARLTAECRTTRLRAGSPGKPLRIIDGYLADVARVAADVESFDRLLDAIALSQAVPYFRKGVRDLEPGLTQQSRKRFARGLRDRRRGGLVLGPSVATSELAARGPERLALACREDIARRIDALARHVVEGLVGELKAGLLGVVVWPGADACWYTRTEHRLWFNGNTTRARGDNRVVVEQSYEHWQACRQVHLIEALHVPGVPRWLSCPEDVGTVAAAIPRLLRPFVRTVVGTMIMCRTVQWFVGNHEESYEQVRPQPQVVVDPAIVIGSAVLAGWETSEHFRPGWRGRLDLTLSRACAMGGRG